MRFRFAEFVLDTETGELTGSSGPVPLRRQAWRLLEVLVRQAPALVSRDALLDTVWGHDALSPNVLPQTISELRQALGDSAQQPRLIETRPRRGYRLMVPVEAADGDVAAPPAIPAAGRTRPMRSRPWRPAQALVLLLATAVPAAWLLLRQAGDEPPVAALPADGAEGAVADQAAVGPLAAAVEQQVLLGEGGEAAQALAALQALAEEVDAQGDPLLLARHRHAIGLQGMRLGERDLAASAFGEAAAQARQAGAGKLEAGAWNNLAILWMRERRPDEAERAWTKALEAFENLDDGRGAALALGNLAAAASAQGRPGKARELNHQALARFRALGLDRDVARTAFNLGLVATRMGELDEAVLLFDEALAITLADQAFDTALHVAAQRIQLHLEQAQPEPAAMLLERMEPVYAATASALPRAALDAAASKHARLAGNLENARQLQARAFGLRQEGGSPAWAWASELELLRLDLLAEQPPGGIRARAEQLAYNFREAGEPRDALRARMLEAEALLRHGRPAEAAALLDEAAPLLDEFADAAVAMELRRLRLLSGGGSSLSQRLLALAAEAEQRGLVLSALRCRHDAARHDDGRALAALQGMLEARGLPGLLLE